MRSTNGLLILREQTGGITCTCGKVKPTHSFLNETYPELAYKCAVFIFLDGHDKIFIFHFSCLFLGRGEELPPLALVGRILFACAILRPSPCVPLDSHVFLFARLYLWLGCSIHRVLCCASRTENPVLMPVLFIHSISFLID